MGSEEKTEKKVRGVNGVKLAFYGTILVAIIGLISVLISSIISSKTQKEVLWIPATQTALAISATDTVVPTSQSQNKIFEDHFDNNSNKWDTGASDANTHRYEVEIQNGGLQRYMKTEDRTTFCWGATAIPGVYEKNFCLIFDVRIIELSRDVGIVIVFRATDYHDRSARKYYRLRLIQDGRGSLWGLVSDEEQRITEFSGINFGVDKSYTIKISMQDNDLAIYDLKSGTLLQNVIIDEDKLLVDLGEIRLGSELFAPNQEATIKFDNVFVFDKCP